MEGLIPMMYRAMKRSRVRSRYECLSAGASQTYNVADFYTNGQVQVQAQAQPYPHSHSYLGPASDKTIHNQSRHRRYRTAGEYSFRLMSSGNEDDMNALRGVVVPHSKQVGRLRRSHSVLSCFTGA